MTVTYPNVDLSGVNPDNLVKQELHTVSEANFRDYYFIVPNFAPFYVDNFKLWIKSGETLRPLVEDVDFSFAIPYVTGTRVTGKQMYGAVTLHNLNSNGILVMNYQTIGGDQIADRLHVLTYLADKAYNPRTTIWDVITNVPNSFPPSPHYQDYEQFYGQEKLVQALVEIRDAILSNSSLTREKIEEFLQMYNGSGSVYVKVDGATMRGPLTLPGLPSEPKHAASKAYVDQRVADQSDLAMLLGEYVRDTDFHTNMELKVDKTGSVMTGPLALYADPVQDDQATTKRYTDSLVNQLSAQVQQLQQTVNSLQTQTTGLTLEYVNSRIDEVVARFSSYK